MITISPVSHVPPPAARILHLEDSATDHALLRWALRHAAPAHEVVQVETLPDFVQQLHNHPFDAIVADYRLPGFTALDALNALQQLPDAPPMVLLSGAIGEAAAVDAMRLGMADYLLKDDIARLPHVLQRAIEVHEARRAREQAAAELAASERRLAELAEHLQTSIEEERAAIAREIHDDIGGSLAAVKFDLAWIARHGLAEEGMRSHTASAGEMLQHAIDASQRIMLHLRPPVLDQGLAAAVQWLAQSFERRTGLAVRLHCSDGARPVPAALQLVAYRTAQEALTNVHKHAQAREVRIELSDHEGVLTLEVSDDGRGIAPGQRDRADAFGLRGLAERAHRAGGWMDVSSRAGQGTTIIVSLPLPGPEGTP